MKTIVILATLVAVLTFNGCYALTGCPGSPQCDPNWVNDADGDNNADGGLTSKGDDGSVTETATVETAPTVQEVCKDYLYLEGTKWVCDYDKEETCTLGLTVLESGACGVRCPGTWKAQADTILFPPGKLVFDNGQGSGPHTCEKVK